MRLAALVGLTMVGALVFVADVLFAGWAAIADGVIAAKACVVLWAVLPLVRRQRLRVPR